MGINTLPISVKIFISYCEIHDELYEEVKAIPDMYFNCLF